MEEFCSVEFASQSNSISDFSARAMHFENTHIR